MKQKLQSMPHADELAPSAGLSTIQRRHERLRRTLYEEAGKLFEENGGEEGNGFEATTVEAIAARSDISTRTFFRHFESKADVIYLDLRRSMEEYFAALDRHLPADDGLSAAVLARIDQMEEFSKDPLNLVRLLRALRSRHFVNRRAAWYAELQDKLQERLVAQTPPGPNAAAHAALAAAMAVKIGELGLHQWSSQGGKDKPAACIAQAYLWCREMFAANHEIGRVILEEKHFKPKPLLALAKGKQ